MNQHIVKAKRLSNGEWLQGYYYYNDYKDGPNHWLLHFENGIRRHSAVDPNTVCRFIGLKDKNNAPIFEYDIIETWHNKEIENFGYFPVAFDDFVAPLMHNVRKEGYIKHHDKWKVGLAIFWKKGHMDIMNSLQIFNCDGVVIGNMFDSKE